MSDPLGDIVRRISRLETMAQMRPDRPATTASAWTPRLYDTAGNVSVATYTNQDGSYLQLGALVWIYGYIVVATISGAPGAGVARIDGLPITPIAGGFWPLTVARARIDYQVAPVDYQMDVNGASNLIQLYQTRDNVAITELTAASIAVNFTVAFSGWYIAG